jgi:hypothetical protein
LENESGQRNERKQMVKTLEKKGPILRQASTDRSEACRRAAREPVRARGIPDRRSEQRARLGSKSKRSAATHGKPNWTTWI